MMNPIDTVEIVQATAEACLDDGWPHIEIGYMLERYAALLEAVNRPVTDEQVQIVADKLDDLFSVEDTQEPAFLADVRAILESHMAALREEVGK